MSAFRRLRNWALRVAELARVALWSPILRIVSIPLCLVALAGSLWILRDYALKVLGQPLEVFDEPLQLVGAMFIRLGQKPMVDFQSVYPPGNYYLAAAAFRLFGDSVVTFRLYEAATLLTALAGIALLSRRLGMGMWAVGGSVLVFTWVAVGTLDTATTPATALAVAFVAVFDRSLHATWRRSKILWSCLAALLFFATIFTRVNFALYVAAAILGERAVVFLLAGRTGRRSFSSLVSPFFIAVLALLGAFVCVFWRGHLVSFVAQITYAPAEALRRYCFRMGADYTTAPGRNEALENGLFLPMVPGLWLAARALGSSVGRRWLPFLLGVSGALAVSFLEMRWGSTEPTRLPMVAVIATLPLYVAALVHPVVRGTELISVGALGLSSHYFLSRPDPPHFLSLLPFMAAVIPFVWPTKIRLLRLLPGALLFFLLNPIATKRWASVDEASKKHGGEIWQSRSTFMSGGDARAASHREDPLVRSLFPLDEEIAAIAEIRKDTPESAPIFIGFRDHAENSLVNDVRAYWLAGRRTAVHAIMMMNGITTPPAAEQKIIDDLERTRPPRIMLWQGYAMSASWGLYLAHDSDHRLDKMIASHFRLVGKHPNFDVLERRDDVPWP